MTYASCVAVCALRRRLLRGGGAWERQPAAHGPQGALACLLLLTTAISACLLGCVRLSQHRCHATTGRRRLLLICPAVLALAGTCPAMQARKEARREEEIKRREAELLEARKAYFEERKQVGPS